MHRRLGLPLEMLEGSLYAQEDFGGSLKEDFRLIVTDPAHVLAEVAQTVDDVVVIHRGRLVDQGPVARLTAGGALSPPAPVRRSGSPPGPHPSTRPGRQPPSPPVLR